MIQIPRPSKPVAPRKARNPVLARRNAFMKEAQKDGFTQEDIAYMFGVQQPVVSLVLRNSKSHVAA